MLPVTNGWMIHLRIEGPTSTILLEIIMTTTPRIVVANDLFAQNDVLNLRREGSCGDHAMCELAAFSCVANGPASGETWSDACTRVVPLAERFLDRNREFVGEKLLLFVRAGAWGKQSRIAHKIGPWALNEELAAIRGRAIRVGPTLAKDGEGGVVFFAVAEFEFGSFSDCADFARQWSSSFLVICRSGVVPSAGAAELLFSHAFRSERGALHVGTVDWTALSCEVCRAGDIVIRVSGAFDDPDIAVDFIYDPRVVSLRPTESSSRPHE